MVLGGGDICGIRKAGKKNFAKKKKEKEHGVCSHIGRKGEDAGVQSMESGMGNPKAFKC